MPTPDVDHLVCAVPQKPGPAGCGAFSGRKITRIAMTKAKRQEKEYTTETIARTQQKQWEKKGYKVTRRNA